MAAVYSVTRAPRCCGEMLTFEYPMCKCIVCGKEYPTSDILDFFYKEVLHTLPEEAALRIKRKINRMTS